MGGRTTGRRLRLHCFSRDLALVSVLDVEEPSEQARANDGRTNNASLHEMRDVK